MMITKRQLLVTILIFLILLMLFMGFQIGKEAVSSSPRNPYASDISAKEPETDKNSGFLVLSGNEGPAELTLPDTWVLYLGSEESDYAGTVGEWAGYTGTPVVLSRRLPVENGAALPALLMVEPDFVKGCSRQIAQMMEQGVDVIFLALPDCAEVEADALLQELLGIRAIRQPEIGLRGIHLFSGFLLGGERIFEADGGAGTEKQDLDLHVPWYSVRVGTKTFMRGILGEADLVRAQDSKLKNEDMPAILWRSHFGEGEAYAVNGRYMANRRIGIGLLQAMMYERADCLLYPVVNAQLFTVANFPMLTDENAAEVLRIYGRSVEKVQTDIITPMLITLSSKHGSKPSCFLSVRYDPDDAALPRQGALQTYLPIVGEMNGELAFSADSPGTAASVEEKIRSDWSYYKAEGLEYRLTAALVSSEGLSALEGALEQAGIRDIRTIATSDYSEQRPVVGYLSPGVTCQQATSDLTRHSFTDELELLGVQTMLAYGNGFYNMADTFYPKSAADEWQNISRAVFSNLTTYNHPFRAEDRVTVTESDARIRSYLSLRYDAERKGDVLSVTISGDTWTGSGYFILRTHDEVIESIDGGSYVPLEENAYLISAGQETLELRLASSLSALVNMEGRNR